MEAIHDVHVSEPGLVVVDIAAAGDKTMFTFHTAPAARWATTSTEPEDAAEHVRSYCWHPVGMPSKRHAP
ncbi:DUF6207 family protein [Streptomyces sp. NPDC051135]|uniref:DUF6207 family protein n=1 Tax=unclassified Streptomyces TaxID=2593676 RepID=UPI00341E97FB